MPVMALPNSIPAYSLHQGPETKNRVKWARGQAGAGSAPCDAAKVSRGTLCPGCSVHRDSLWPRPSNTTAVSQEPTVTRSRGGRVEQPGASLSLRRCSGSQSRLSGGDTQLGAWRRSWASGPRRPPRLPGCTGRCCSGRVSGNHRDRPLQTSAPLVLPSLGAEVSSFPSSPSFDISPSFLFFSPVFFSHRLPSSWVWKQMSVRKSRALLRPQVLPAKALRGPCRD